MMFTIYTEYHKKKLNKAYNYMKKHYICIISHLVILTNIFPLSINAQMQNDNYVKKTIMLNSEATDSMVSIQYYDGLGRPTQIADGGAGNGTNYVHTLQEYDLNGRESLKWLPISSASNTALQKSSFVGVHGSAYGYSTIEYDALDRPVFISTPGQAWHDAGKGKTINYVTNGSDVKHYAASGNTSLSMSYYPANSLTGEETIDEDGHTITVFKDLMGNVVLERRNGTNDTYYVYNDKCQLTYVLPPIIDSFATNGVSSSLLSQYAYRYEYDNFGRCTKKTLPGCAPIKYTYDKYGRLAFMQDGRMRTRNVCRFYLYDQLGRLAVQGICDTIPLNMDNLPANVGYGIGNVDVCNTGYRTMTGYSPHNAVLEIANYYDNYNFLNTGFVQSIIGNADFSNSGHCDAISFLTGQILSTSNGEHLCSVLYYDEKGNVIENSSIYPSGLSAKTQSTYTFTNNISETTTYYKKDNFPLPFDKITRKYTYAHELGTNADLLMYEDLSFGNNAPVRVNSYGYNSLGQNTSCQQGGLISNSYTYDVHGWLKSSSAYKSGNAPNILLYETLHYADSNSSPCYNGNISAISYMSANDNSMKEYKFTYDNMDRLITAYYSANNSSNETGSYSEIIGYNANSSITDILRSGKRNNGYGYIDALNYTYEGNQLKSITDHIHTSYTLYEGSADFKDNATLDIEYVYDSCGSIIQDKNKEICLIEYDYNGMPKKIQFKNGSITEYIYAADCTKLRTIHRKSVPGIYVPYGYSGELTPSQTLSVDSTTYIGSLEIDQYFNSKYYYGNGYIALGNAGGGTYHYMVSDHLGNTRAVVNSSGTVEQVNNYYPYGGLLNDVTYTTDVQNHKYNGKEYDSMHGLNEYDYGARRYDPVIGMFTSMDPLCEKYYHISPYSYCGGNPMNRVDLDGMDWYEHNGQKHWFNSVTNTYIDDKNIHWVNIGHTYTDPKTRTYYSLFGQEYDSKNKNINAIKLIDNALISYAKYEAKMEKAYTEHNYEGVSESEPTFNFSNMYPFVNDKSILRMGNPNIHNITYGDDPNAETNTIISQVSDVTMAITKISERFKEMDRRGYNKTSSKGIGIVFVNKSGKDIVSIIIKPERAKIPFGFYKKLVKYYK